MAIILEHIGIAVRSIEKRAALYEQALGMAPTCEEALPDSGVKVKMFDAGGATVELIEPLGDASPIEGFLNRKGEGIHHICFGVSNIAAVLSRLEQDGLDLIDKTPRKGQGGSLIAFINPRSTGGVLIELKEVGPLRIREVLTPAEIQPGSVVIASLMNPREKIWGILKSLDTVGIQLLGIELDAVGDLIREVSKGSDRSMGLSSLFFPMWRVEKVFLDESVGGIKALHRHFAEMAGCEAGEILEILSRYVGPS